MAMLETFALESPMGYQPYSTIPPLSRRRTNHTISDLVDQFHQHTLTSKPSRSSSALSLPSSALPRHTARPRLVTTRSASPSRSPSPPSHAAYRRMSASALRAQRQANIRLLSDAAHLQELHDLVERMVDARDQCRVGTVALDGPSAPSSPVSSTATLGSSGYVFAAADSPRTEDEGFGEEMDEDEDGSGVESLLTYRRSGELGVPSTVPCVRKDIKVRKRRQRSAGAR